MAPGARNKFGAPMFEPEDSRKRMYYFEKMCLWLWCDFLVTNCHGRPQGGQNEHPPLEIRTKKQKFLVNVKPAVQLRLVCYFLRWQFVCQYNTHNAQEPVHCSGIMQSGNCSSLYPLLWLQMQVASLGSEICSTIRLCCVTMTWQHIFKRFTLSCSASVVAVLSHVAVECRHLDR